jgi:peptidoglycan/LPS O-acetylase OafA/YrhL
MLGGEKEKLKMDRATSESGSQRFPLLNGLRAIAIILVVLCHVSTSLDRSVGTPLRNFLATGWIGVYLFFVLSGFLVGNLAFSEIRRTGKLNLKIFWARRFLRTWPLYFVLLAFNYWRSDTISPSIIHYFTFTQNFYEVKFFTPTWSLAVEEQFYFIFPLILLVLIGLKSFRVLLSILFGGIFSAYLTRYFFGASTNTIEVYDSILIGILIAYGLQFHPSVINSIKKNGIVVFCAGILFVYLPFLMEDGRVKDALLTGCMSIGFGFILISCLNETLRFGSLLKSRTMNFIALVSYSVYLSHHQSIFKTLQLAEYLKLKGWGQICFAIFVGLSVSIIVGALLYAGIEKPAMQIRNKLFPRR